MKIDLHCHSKYSNDNYLEPDDLIRQSITMKLDGVFFVVLIKKYHNFATFAIS